MSTISFSSSEEIILEKNKKSIITCETPENNFVQQPIDPKDEVTCDYYFFECHHFIDVRWAVLFHSAAIFMQAMFVSGFIAGTMTTIERRYGLSSSEIGVISSMYDLGQLLFLLPVSYLGSLDFRKMRIESIGLFIMGVSALLYATPHFILDDLRPKTHQQIIPICNSTTPSEESTCGKQVNMAAGRRMKWCFWVANFLFGIGASPLFSIGTAFVDENSPQDKGYFYFAIINSNLFFGAALGNVLVGKFLQISDAPVHDKRKLLPSIHEDHMGAWWIGPILTAVACFIVLVPLIGIPKQLPEFISLQEERLSRERIFAVPKRTFSESMQDIMKNYILILVCIAVACELLFFTGLMYFGPKYMELTFSLSKTLAPLIIGSGTVASGASGILIGGWITRKGNFYLKGNLIMLASIALFNLFPVCGFLIKCTALQLEGDAACNRNCNCSNETQHLNGCGADLKNYKSPCFAGCRTANVSGFFDCSCIQSLAVNVPEWRNGYCTTPCSVALPAFILIMALEIFGTCLIASPGINAVLRCVDEGLQTIALGLAGVFSRLLGSVPGPLIFAYLIDASCKSWNYECGTRGHCKQYHLQQLRQYFFAVTLTCKCISSASLCVALFLHLRNKSWPSRVSPVAPTPTSSS